MPPLQLARVTRGVLSRLAVHVPPLVRWLPVGDSLVAEYHPSLHRAGERDLLVLLPGIGDMPRDFSRWGFIEELHGRAFPMDVVAVDTHYGYYARRTVIECLHRDVMRPAGRVYRRIWLGGISLGGFGALYYASHYPHDITGVIAMAPFLGRRPLLEEIARAGGLLRWQPRPEERDEIRRLWSWLKDYGVAGRVQPSLMLAYGDRDTFAMAHQLWAVVLPGERVFVEPGGHDWKTWRRLWDRVVQSRPFALHREPAT